MKQLSQEEDFQANSLWSKTSNLNLILHFEIKINKNALHLDLKVIKIDIFYNGDEFE